jgi:lipopolysaccharide export system permease protein
MLTILDRQMIYSYVKSYFFCLVSLTGLFIVVDLFMNLEDFTANRKDFLSVVEYIGIYYGYKSFQIFDRLCEPVVLLAGMFTVAWVQRNNELLPLLSAGVSTRRFVLPVLLCAMSMMGLVVANQELALPSIDAFMVEHRANPDGAREISDVKGAYDMNGIFISGKSAVKKDSLVNGFFVSIPAQISRSSITILQAKEAYYIPEQPGDKRTGGWYLKQTMPPELPAWPHDQEDILKPLGNGEYFLKTKDVDLETIVRVKNWYMYQPTDRLLRELDRPGNTQHASLAVTFHMRLTRPLLGMILVLVGLSVILRDQNRNVFISAGMCLLLCVGFFASIFACQFLGKTGVEIISPALAAWLPVLLFGPASFVMFDMVHT